MHRLGPAYKNAFKFENEAGQCLSDNHKKVNKTETGLWQGYNTVEYLGVWSMNICTVEYKVPIYYLLRTCITLI